MTHMTHGSFDFVSWRREGSKAEVSERQRRKHLVSDRRVSKADRLIDWCRIVTIILAVNSHGSSRKSEVLPPVEAGPEGLKPHELNDTRRRPSPSSSSFGTNN